MGNFFKDNEDLQFYFDRGIDWAPLVALTEHHFRAADGPESAVEAVELYRDIADLIGKFAADEVAPHAAQLDREKVGFEDGEAMNSPFYVDILPTLPAVISSFVLALLLIALFLWMVLITPMLRDPGGGYSLGRAQMAWWTLRSI